MARGLPPDSHAAMDWSALGTATALWARRWRRRFTCVVCTCAASLRGSSPRTAGASGLLVWGTSSAASAAAPAGVVTPSTAALRSSFLIEDLLVGNRFGSPAWRHALPCRRYGADRNPTDP